MTIESAAREIAASRFREWLESKCDDHNWPQPISAIVAQAEHFFADDALRVECERLVREWRKWSEEYLMMAGGLEHANRAQGHRLSACATALSAALGEQSVTNTKTLAE